MYASGMAATDLSKLSGAFVDKQIWVAVTLGIFLLAILLGVRIPAWQASRRVRAGLLDSKVPQTSRSGRSRVRVALPVSRR